MVMQTAPEDNNTTVHRNVITLLGAYQIMRKPYGLIRVLLHSCIVWIPIKNMRKLYEMTMMLSMRGFTNWRGEGASTIEWTSYRNGVFFFEKKKYL